MNPVTKIFRAFMNLLYAIFGLDILLITYYLSPSGFGQKRFRIYL